MSHTYCDRGPAIPPGRRRPAPGLKRKPVPRKLSPEKAELIRIMYATGLVSQGWLGRYLQVSHVAVWNVVQGYTYAPFADV